MSNIASTLQQVSDNGNTTSNTVQFTNATTSLKTTGNADFGSQVFVRGVESGYFPIVNSSQMLEKSTIHLANGTTTISNNVEISGNLIVSGNSYTIESNNVVIEDRILAIANNNQSHTHDVGLIFQHPGANVAFIHHGEGGEVHEHYISLGYTKHTTWRH